MFQRHHQETLEVSKQGVKDFSSKGSLHQMGALRGSNVLADGTCRFFLTGKFTGD